MKEWKTRFNYSWDWQPRLMQLGIWDSILIEEVTDDEINQISVSTDADLATSTGLLDITGKIRADSGSLVSVTLKSGERMIKQETTGADQFSLEGIHWHSLPVALWYPNLAGSQPLYEFEVVLIDKAGGIADRADRTVGFKHVAWELCEDSPEGADPWICVVNGERIFLQGVNFPPVLPNYADSPQEKYYKLLSLYRSLGMNVLRLNACGTLETEYFYQLCDQFGLLVWQEFPLTSSGVDNIPPDDPSAISEMCEIARSFIERRQHHVSLLLWSGGNELIDLKGKPIGVEHPMLTALQGVVTELDPRRRYIPASPSGPVAVINEQTIGKGQNWDVHGPWLPSGTLEAWKQFWNKADALFYSEIGSPGASPLEIILDYAGGMDPMPVDAMNPFWKRPVAWWIEPDRFQEDKGRAPDSLEEYIGWSQGRQAEALRIAVQASKDRFPKCGGAILWCGHDCFPCPTNTSIVDFNGNPKPAAIALGKVYKSKV